MGDPQALVATKSGYTAKDNVDYSNDHYWMNCTTNDSTDTLFYLLNKGIMSKIGNWYEVLHIMTKTQTMYPVCNTSYQFLRRFDVQTSWRLQLESTIYSVSVKERTTDFCLQLNQEVIP